jgi:hypothetical protein
MNVALENDEGTNANNVLEVVEEVEEVTDNQEDTPELLTPAEVIEDENDEDSVVGLETEVVSMGLQQGPTEQEEMKMPEIIETKKIPAVKKKRQPTPQERSVSILRDQLKSQVDRSRTVQDVIKGMQRQLLRIDKVINANNKQQAIVGRLEVRLNEVQKRLDKVTKAQVAATKSKSKSKAGAAKTKPKKSNKTKAKSKTKTKKNSIKKRSKNR